MAKRILAVVAGLGAWVIVATIGGLIMRTSWPEYAAAADAMTFTLPMMFARLSIGAVATIAAGWVTAVIWKRTALLASLTGLVVLLLFIPQHIVLWAKFPVWYHLTFLSSLVPLTYAGGLIAARWRAANRVRFAA
jgi:hypothetical protein